MLSQSGGSTLPLDLHLLPITKLTSMSLMAELLILLGVLNALSACCAPFTDVEISPSNVDRTMSFNENTCLAKGGYKHSDRYCYFTPNYCGTYYDSAICHCYLNSSSAYTNATCTNIRGVFANERCYYSSFYCYYYWVRGQCYNRRYRTYSYTCPSYRVYYNRYCYYNIF